MFQGIALSYVAFIHRFALGSQKCCLEEVSSSLPEPGGETIWTAGPSVCEDGSMACAHPVQMYLLAAGELNWFISNVLMG